MSKAFIQILKSVGFLAKIQVPKSKLVSVGPKITDLVLYMRIIVCTSIPCS